MYRILIADDEDIIREGIKHLFCYEELGFTICAEASTGDGVLEKMLTLQPDVVLLDIRMPGMSGLDALSQARAKGFRGKVVIISSYTEFKYAQEAMRHGTQHYIIKPIDDDELRSLLLSLRSELDEESARQNASNLYRQKARNSLLEEIITGVTFPFPNQLTDLQLQAPCYQVVLLCRPVQSSSTVFSHDKALKNNCDHLLINGQEVLLVRGENAISHLHELSKAQTEHETESGVGHTFFACGSVVHGSSEISASYAMARQLLERRFFCDPGQNVLEPCHLPTFSEELILNNDLLQKYASTILDGITSFNRRVIAQALKDLGDQLYGAKDSIDSMRLFLTDLYLQVKMQVRHLYTGMDIPFLSNAEIIRTIGQADYLYQIIAFFSQRFETYMSATGTSTRDSVLEDTLHYIHCNYASNITLENIAPLFGYNRSYLGRIFTKKMGVNFNAYVDQVRIDRSKEMLLNEDTKVYIIAERVGYKNVDYFHLKFRKYVGMSPSEFRKKYKGSSCSVEKQNMDNGSIIPEK